MITDNTGITFTPKETSQFVIVGSSLAGIIAWAAAQESGKRGFREGSAERLDVAVSVRSKMQDIADIAKAMKEEGDEGVAEKFRMPQQPPYVVLMAVAQSFVDEAEPMKAAFIERGMPATFVDDLEALLPEFAAASVVKHEGSAEQIGGTAGLEAMAAAGMRCGRCVR